MLSQNIYIMFPRLPESTNQAKLLSHSADTPFSVFQGGMAKLLSGVCFVLPSTVQGQCSSFLQEYAPMIAKITVLVMDNPGEICKFLSFCPAASKMSGMNYHYFTCTCKWRPQDLFVDQRLELGEHGFSSNSFGHIYSFFRFPA